MPSQRTAGPKRSTLATKLRILNQIAFDRRSTRLFSQLFYRSTGAEPEEYCEWYFNNLVWQDTTWMGIETYKSPCDMWNYQEILVQLKPSLIIEFGTAFGGSAVYWASVMRQTGEPFKVLSVDISHDLLRAQARRDPDVEFLESSSASPKVAERIRELRNEYPGKVWAILDSDHSMDHVLAEMKLLRPLLSADDYLVVEDSLLNGHPVAPEWGPGPYEAIEAYENEFPDDYTHDTARENKFGWSFAPYGFLIRN
ncbi:rhamnosyl O-methyltransferase [Mycolicibacterium holsaticum]|uniref:rhamnosyl O-methyltransferase n=1 Tax=Mycolicibacterium holsaticum TaxID=152142 RepID=UPI001C7D02E9|nr:CmcI family methyltransferase [Mycolicibacterium holsaticum]MDA4110872.1 rhamnosyl O-methyltransferase [Mycolicibacterium holsaticum DSM 44478 = JCM 12374]QZA12183.1 rhamnosyl O-methyltransferase [Mycolicibacterium holsaticum DSM 44478 = JCM 12374]UNC10331.1 rhamnosyl O-methyltransferase [Mycolicibacterium holsaticum DSM 44478 = JCM 12374]